VGNNNGNGNLGSGNGNGNGNGLGGVAGTGSGNANGVPKFPPGFQSSGNGNTNGNSNGCGALPAPPERPSALRVANSCQDVERLTLLLLDSVQARED
jgi:hypothetical protein